MNKFTFKIQYFIIILLSFFIFSKSAFAQVPEDQVAGKVNFLNVASSSFDSYTKDPTLEQQIWMTTHYERMLTYTPYFDSRLSWYPDALVYRDSYAIYKGSQLEFDHPEWIMRDAEGNKLYIPYACSNGSCSQYAGDFSNPEFRDYMIDQFTNIISKGYRGLWLDDVNQAWRVGDGNGNFVNPIDSSTGELMTFNNWQGHMAVYMEEIREALPDIEISHNVIWYRDDYNAENPYINREIDATNYINLERGGNDSGLVNGLGQYGFETFLNFIDNVHNRGANVIIMDHGENLIEREYGLATLLLVSKLGDLFYNTTREWTTPDTWWNGFDLNLGNALGSRYKLGELIRRDFECGSVILNQPGLETQTINIETGYTNLDGEPITSVELAAKTAAILLKTCDNQFTDTEKPSITITSLSENNVVSGSIMVEVNANDNVGVNEVILYANGVQIGTDNTAPFQYNWDTNLEQDGNITLTAYAYDAANNVGETSITIIVENNTPTPPDTTDPIINFKSLVDGDVVNGSIMVEVNANDNVGVNEVRLYANGVQIGTDNTAPFQYNWDTNLEQDGNITLTAYAYDAANNEGVTSITIIVENNTSTPPDTTDPTITLMSPVDGNTVSGTVTIESNGDDNIGITKHSIYVDGNLRCTSDTEYLVCNWNARKEALGNHEIKTRVEDASGNFDETTISVIVEKRKRGRKK